MDSCAFDPKYYPENEASNKIYQLFKNEKLKLVIAHSTQKEIDHPNTPDWVKNEALNMIYTLESPINLDELKELRDIEKIIAGNGKIENIKEDAKHIFECKKYGSYFITTDNRLLKRKKALFNRFKSFIILKPSEFLSLVEENLNKQNYL